MIVRIHILYFALSLYYLHMYTHSQFTNQKCGSVYTHVTILLPSAISTETEISDSWYSWYKSKLDYLIYFEIVLHDTEFSVLMDFGGFFFQQKRSCVHVCIHNSTMAAPSISLYQSTYLSIYLRIHIYTYICMYICIYMYINTYIYVQIYIRIHIIHTHIHVCIYVHITCKYKHMNKYIHVYT